MGAEAALIVSKQRKRIIRAFRGAGAIRPESAKTPSEVGLPGSVLLHIQKLRGVLVEVEHGRYYLDVDRYEQLQRTRRVLIPAVIIVVAAVWWILWRLRIG